MVHALLEAKHTCDTCWNIQEKPHDWKPKSKRDGRVNHAKKEQPNQFSKELLEIIQKLIPNIELIFFTPNSNPLVTTNVAHKVIIINNPQNL